MDGSSFREPNQSGEEASSLGERLRRTEDALQALAEANRRMAGLIDRLSSNAEGQRLDHLRLRESLARLQISINAAQRTTQDIKDSRIWRGLVGAARLMLKIRGLFAKPTRPRTERPHRASETRREKRTQFPFRRAWSSRHANGPMTAAAWVEVIRSVARSQAPTQVSAPRISVITPTWNTRLAWFAEAALSVLEQSCQAWEWCIVDDASTATEFQALFPVLEETGKVRIRKLERHAGISEATNEGLRAASVENVCFLDHDDLLAPGALEECLDLLDQGFDAAYSDSDKIDEAGVRTEPFYKPDWSPEYFRGVMYVGHLLCVRRALALRAGGFDSHYDGVQDYEFLLRYSEQHQRIGHVSQVLYHWRTVPGSVASSTEAKGDLGSLQRSAVQEHLRRVHLPATAEPGLTPHRIRIVPLPRDSYPKVSIIIPTRDAPDLLHKCLTSIRQRTTYPEIEIVCVDNETTDPRALNILRNSPVTHLTFPGPFNFSRACNFAARHAAGEYLMFMNNDIEAITPEWAQEMLYYAEQTGVGAAGGLLLYPDRTVQHAGIVLGTRGTADHVLRGAPADSDGYAGSLACAREVSAVTGACMMVSRTAFVDAGGFNEHYFTAYQDVDLCLQLRALGKRNIYCPRAVFYHAESISRGGYYDFVDRNLLLDRWEDMIASDAYYNPNFDVESCDYALAKESSAPRNPAGRIADEINA
jgi:GT2 family glycosyltransferase